MLPFFTCTTSRGQVSRADDAVRGEPLALLEGLDGRLGVRAEDAVDRDGVPPRTQELLQRAHREDVRGPLDERPRLNRIRGHLASSSSSRNGLDAAAGPSPTGQGLTDSKAHSGTVETHRAASDELSAPARTQAGAIGWSERSVFPLPARAAGYRYGEPNGGDMKGSEKPKKLPKKKAQKTLKERRAIKRAAAAESRRDIPS